ncbi:MAG: hypothetical protein IPP73_15325 [Chitinophagaceae bacterium]|nr:hypothetical protein [Chitinophagaceae bacterium]
MRFSFYMVVKARKVEGTAFFRNTRYQPLLLVFAGIAGYTHRIKCQYA